MGIPIWYIGGIVPTQETVLERQLSSITREYAAVFTNREIHLPGKSLA